MDRTALEEISGIGPRLSGSILSSRLQEQAEKEMEFLEKYHISAFCFEDASYPARLKECEDAPIVLFSRGCAGLNSKRVLSVVGTRQASAYGKERCRSIVLELGTLVSDLLIISGLAFGIDVIAHRAALEGGIPTVAVLGHGFRDLYPRAHLETAKTMCRHGALVTDFHSGMGPERNNFLRRNRIIAGMADATLVVESALSGGALITASMASSYQRDVLAVPGRVSDLRSKGCNMLIKKNVAALVESAEDVLNHLNWKADPGRESIPSGPPVPCSAEEKRILELLRSHGGLTPGELSRHSGFPVQVALSLLMQMELKQWVRAEPGNLYRAVINLP
jgi:DNA processing protein